MDKEDLINRFNYHSPDEEKAKAHANVRATLLWAASLINELIPEGREKSLAVTKLEEAMFWANAGLARN